MSRNISLLKKEIGPAPYEQFVFAGAHYVVWNNGLMFELLMWDFVDDMWKDVVMIMPFKNLPDGLQSCYTSACKSLEKSST